MLLLLLAACPRAVTPDEPVRSGSGQTVVMVSMDGFRADYRARSDTPVMDALASEGVWAQALVPAFPTKTFPNHYTIATGLYTPHHGIVDNYFSDPATGESFDMTFGADNIDPDWFLGEPIWVTVEEQGQIAATHFWVGSEVEGRQATYWLPYDGSIPYGDRVETVLDWLELDAPPTFVTLYFDQPDHEGHASGPDNDDVEAVVAYMDSTLGLLVDGLAARDLDVNLVVLSDHGMSQLSADRLVFLDDFIDTWDNGVEAWGPYAAIRPPEGTEDAVVAALAGIEHAACARRDELPAELHYGGSERIAPVICVAEDGWSITTRSWAAAYPDDYEGGTHGYSPTDASMHGIFLAQGPAFQQGVEVDAFESIEVYGLVCEILGLEPAPYDGDVEHVRHLLR